MLWAMWHAPATLLALPDAHAHRLCVERKSCQQNRKGPSMDAAIATLSQGLLSSDSPCLKLSACGKPGASVTDMDSVDDTKTPQPELLQRLKSALCPGLYLSSHYSTTRNSDRPLALGRGQRRLHCAQLGCLSDAGRVRRGLHSPSSRSFPDCFFGQGVWILGGQCNDDSGTLWKTFLTQQEIIH